MKLRIDHLTKYTYPEVVELNPHEIYLTPLQRNYFSTINHELKISPDAGGVNERLDAEGNPYFQVWFENSTDQLEINSRIDVHIGSYNPFGFILESGVSFPFDYFIYPDKYLEPLFLYRKSSKNPHFSKFVKSRMAISTDVVSFLVDLVAQIHQHWDHIIRYEEGLLDPMDTFEQKQGSCRDLSWMMMEMLRSVGIAARFVSGYAFNPELTEGHELHAWVEAFLPGAGWVGLDPSLGLMTDQFYIPLAVSYHPANTLPIKGSYGGKLRSALFSQVNIVEI